MSYEGRFSSNHKQSSSNVDELLASRKAEAEASEARKAAALAKIAAKKAAKDTPRQDIPAEQPPVHEVPAEEAPKQAPAEAEIPTPVKKAPKKEAVSGGNAPTKKKSTKKKKKKKKANRTVTAIFYTVYFLIIIAFFGGMYFVNNWINNWLLDYEAAQPTATCNEVFTRLFADPDWATIYKMAGAEDGKFDGAEEYASYMEAKAGSQELTYAETSAGLSQGHKYLVKLGDETIGYFMLEDQKESVTDIPNWQLSQLHIDVTRTEQVTIQCLEGHKVTVNGVPLDESYVTRISTTMAQKYLPAGTSGVSMQTYQVDGLMTTPEIVVTDENGNVSTLNYNAETDVYEEQTSVNTMGEEERERAQKTAETYGLYMIKEANYSGLAKYFDANSQIFKTITSMQLWMQKHYGYTFEGQEVSEYCRYSDDLFSAKASLSLNVKRSDGSVKEYTVDSTFFFKKYSSGWKCYDMTNVDVQQPISTVRLTFMSDGTVLDTDFYEEDITTLTPPVISAPEGQVFSGWVKETYENGVKTLTLVFTPDEAGNVTIPEGTKLEPMVLYPLFETVEGAVG